MEYNKERFKKVFFEYDEKCSYDFYIDVINWNHQDTPALILEQERIPGASRDTFYSDGTHENKVIDIECYVDVRHDVKRKAVYIKNIKDWLVGFEYKKLKFSDDDGHYEGVCVSNMLFEEVIEGLYRTLISFSCYPYKITKTHSYTFTRNSSITVINEGYGNSPLRVRTEFTEGNVRNFDIYVRYKKQGSSTLYTLHTFTCSSPSDTNIAYVDINSENMTITGTYRQTGSTKDFTTLASTAKFPYIPPGEYIIEVSGFYNGFIKSITVEFDEREL